MLEVQRRCMHSAFGAGRLDFRRKLVFSAPFELCPTGGHGCGSDEASKNEANLCGVSCFDHVAVLHRWLRAT